MSRRRCNDRGRLGTWVWRNWRKGKGLGSGKPDRRRAAELVFEPLEPRILLNSAPAPLVPAPIALNAILVHDTGVSTTDHLTSDSSVRGTVATAQGIADLRAGFDQTSSTNFISVMPAVQPNGSFGLAATRIHQVAGGTLADGTHTLNLLAIAEAGNVKTFS